MNQIKRIKILQRFQKKNPNPKTELNFSSPFELLIAVLLSARTTDIRVNKITNKLYRFANTPSQMLELGVEGVKKYIKSIGLFNNKSKNIIKTSFLLLEKYNGKVPENNEDLEKLPGVGRKTANVILNIAFNHQSIAIDTHVFRVCNRTHFAIGKNPIVLEKQLVKLVPNFYKKNCHNWFVLHGRYICTARKPNCKSCFIEDLCEFSKKNEKITFVQKKKLKS